ncbi:MAG: flagellar motor protein MotB [Labrys sp. (in: a-proteobacteria)]|jgi:chemotaxis protein MotB
MAKKKKAAHGGHGWFVTFADLMGLLMSFFVMLTAYSTMDQAKLEKVAGSMAEAFGVIKESRLSGIVELDGVPTRPNTKAVEQIDPSEATDHPAPRHREVREDGTHDPRVRQGFDSASTSIRQALQSSPELAALSRQVVVEETPEGLSIELVDQDGRAMFADGSSQPNARTQAVLEAIAPVLAHLPNAITITGHTAWNGVDGRRVDGDMGMHWRLSAERAIAIHDVLARSGIQEDRFAAVVGKADSEPMIADDPALSVNRRVSILLANAAPPIPVGIGP